MSVIVLPALATSLLGVHTAPIQFTEGTRAPLTRANTIYGPTGLITIPTAYTVRRGEARVSASFSKNLRGPAVNYGIWNSIEIGGSYMDIENAPDKALANAKVSIVPANFKYFELGVGVIDAADAIDQTFYFVASADLIPPDVNSPKDGSLPIGLKVHAGAGTGLFKEKLFGGAELLFGNKFSIVGEWDTKNFNAALRYSPSDNLSLQLGVRDTNLFFGMTTSLRF